MQHQTLTVNTDGGARGNPGPAAIGVICHSSDGNISSEVPEQDPRTVRFSQKQTPLFTISQYIGETTNNVAEYTAVIKTLEYLKEKGIIAQKINFILDSELVVKQLTGVYKIKQPHLQQLALKVHTLIKTLKAQVSFSNVRREFNKQADALANLALDKKLAK